MANIVKVWIEAMRLRTLPVSVAGVFTALGYAEMACRWCAPGDTESAGSVRWSIFLACLAFAVLAQIASNFANEYFDFRAGLDRAGREGPRRGVTEGDITPRAMLLATLGTLAAGCIIGLWLAYIGGWLILLAGIIIAVGVFSYSAGPYPLSHHGLGEVAVIVFFGLAPVCLTFYLMTGYIDTRVLAGSLAIGLMGANVLLVNNIRDINDDRSVGKHTLAVLIGRRACSFLYLVNGWIAVALMMGTWHTMGNASFVIPGSYLVLHTLLWYQISKRVGRSLNPMLGMTAVLMLAYALGFVIVA